MNATTAHFYIPASAVTDPVLSKFIPRPVRKTLRLNHSAMRKTTNTADRSVHTSLTNYFRTEYRTDAYHNQNLVDAEPLADEFGDIDNEYEGLTIIEAMDEVQLWKFCTGYDVL